MHLESVYGEKAYNSRKQRSGAHIITVMAGFPQLRMLARDYRHNVAVNDVAYKYTNNEANRAFNDSAATLTQNGPGRTGQKQNNLCPSVEHLLKIIPSSSSHDTLCKMQSNKQLVKMAWDTIQHV